MLVKVVQSSRHAHAYPIDKISVENSQAISNPKTKQRLECRKHKKQQHQCAPEYNRKNIFYVMAALGICGWEGLDGCTRAQGVVLYVYRFHNGE